MRIAERRQVIEVLLCAATGNDTTSVCGARHAVGVSYAAVWSVIDNSYRSREPLEPRFSDRLHVIAYRLIESSPTLRREWFGAQ